MVSSGREPTPATMTGIETIPTLSPEQQGVSQALSAYLLPRVGQGLEGYSGQAVAPMSAYEQAGMESLANYLGAASPYGGLQNAQVQRMLTRTPSTTITPETTQAFYEKSVAAPAYKQFREETLPGIRESFAGPGGTFWGGARAGAERKATSDLEAALASERANLMYQDEQARRGLAETAEQRAVQGVSLADYLAQEPLRKTEAALTYGALPRQLEQAQLEAEVNEWLRTRPEMSPAISQAMSYLGIPTNAMYPTYSTPQAASQGFNMAGALQGGLLGGTTALALAPMTGGLSLPLDLALSLSGALSGGYS